MEFYISLFGEKEDVLGWLELFEQEKLVFKYKGKVLINFSTINIFVGSKFPRKIEKLKNRKKVFILESLCVSKKEKEVRIEQKENLLILHNNISLLLTRNRHNRNELLNILKEVLLKAFTLIRLPYIHIWYYPQPCKTILLFRQDVDYVEEKGLENLISITSRFNIRGTYFVNISGEEEFDDKIGHLELSKPTTPDRKEILFKLLTQGNEIANHGYWHWVFEDFKNNFQNIRKCNWYLKKFFSIKSKGFASPGGDWNKSLAKAIEQNKLLYSSNGLSNGGFPYYPYLNGQKTKSLEIPFYFFCDASFNHYHVQESIDILRDYYLTLINENLKNGYPLAFMGHPHLIGKFAKSFYLPIFQRLKNLKIPNLTMQEFARWWKKREKLNIFCQKSGDKLIIKSNKANTWIEIIYKKTNTILKTDCNGELEFNL